MMATCLVILAGLALLFSILLILGLWGSYGGLRSFLAGQFAPQPRNLGTGISLEGGDPSIAYEVQVRIDLKKPVNQVSRRYLSFSLDTSQVVGGKWWNPQADRKETGSGSVHAPVFDFSRPKLDVLARGLSPAYLRIGGSEADKLYYAIDGQASAPPAGFASLLTRAQWDAIGQFALRNELQLVLTLNVGPGTWQGDGRWQAEHAEKLVAYSADMGYPVALWELGNELNAFWFIHGLDAQLTPARYHQALEAASALVKRYDPGAWFSGQASAYWPVLGEPLGLFFGFQEGYLARSGYLVDLVAWHYYPQQSRREPLASRRAHPARLLDPRHLDEAAYWAGRIIAMRDAYAPGKPIWLGESGNAQAGGEPGVSDVYIGGLWWLDQLGLLARCQHQVVIRQTLCGSHYGMLEDDSLDPRPDYWNSLLWRRLMGTTVYRTGASGENAHKLRIYAHSGPTDAAGNLTVLAINLDHQRDALVKFPQLAGRDYEVYQVNAPDVLGKVITLNGEALKLKDNGTLPQFEGVAQRGADHPTVSVHPLSYSFVVFHLEHEGR